MAKICDILTIILTVILCIRYFKEMVCSSRYIVYFLFIILYVVPIILDYTLGFPAYTRISYYGFNISYNDETTRIIYDIAILFSQMAILRFRRRKIKGEILIESSDERNGIDFYSKQIKTVLILFMVLPVILTIVFPVNKGILLSFQWREMGRYATNKYTSMLEKFSYPAVVAAALMMSDTKTKKSYKAIYALFIFLNICIEGKRSILFFLLVTIVIIQIPGLRATNLSQKERKKKLLGLGLFAAGIVAIMLVTTVLVKINNRGYSLSESDLLYTTVRVDLFRDDRVRMAIYSLLHSNELKILDYPGQTFIPIFTWLFPIDYILTKFGVDFASYQVFFSSALRGVSFSRDVAYMTPCIYAELVSNFGFFGFLLMPAICIWISNIADRKSYPYNVLVLTAFLAMQLYTTRYIAYLYELVLIISLLTKVRFKISRK